MISLNIIFVFLKCLFNGILGIKSPFLAAFKSLKGKSFRIPQNDTNRIFFLFIVFKNTLCTIWTSKIIEAVDKTEKSAVYDIHATSFELRKTFIRSFHKDDHITKGIFKIQLLNSYYHFYNKLSDSFLFFFLFLFFFPLAALSKNKGTIILIPVELIENIQLIRNIKNNNVKTIYFFCIYEKDANFAALLLKKYNVNCFKITSEVPLAVWNKTIIADHICICFGYQAEELVHFRNSMFYSDYMLWGPEKSHLVKSLYDNEQQIVLEMEKSANTVGFYSTGGWLRKKLGHIDQDREIEENELLVLNTIIRYCKKEQKKLLVFLHPREKAVENFQSTQLYYKEQLKQVDYEFANLTENTSALFAKVNLAVAFTSTVVFERLYFGFKTLIMPVGFENFPLPNSPIANICKKSELDLYSGIAEAMNQTTEAFFVTNQLEKYSLYKR